MAEALRNDAEIITGIFGPKPDDPAKQVAYANATGKVAQACKRAREDERRRFTDMVQAAADVVSAKLDTAHAKELQSLAFHMQDTVGHVKGAAFWRGAAIMAIMAVVLSAATGYGAYVFGVETQANTAAVIRATNAQPRWEPPEQDPREARSFNQ